MNKFSNMFDVFRIFRSKFLDLVSNNSVLLADIIVDFFTDIQSNKKMIIVAQAFYFPIKNPSHLFKLCQK